MGKPLRKIIARKDFILPRSNKFFLTLTLIFLPVIYGVFVVSHVSPRLKNEANEKTILGDETFNKQPKKRISTLLFNPEIKSTAYTMQDTKCGDCQNPLVQVMPFQIGGDIPIFDKDPAWERLKNGELDFSDNWWRGMEFATNFIKKNPCADIYYEMDNPNPYGDPIIHVGPLGKAKYEVRSWAVIENASAGEKTLVRHEIDKRIPLSEPRMTRGGTLERYDVERISTTLELVPLLGQIQVSHDLIALKNNQKYDSGTEFWDWIPAPPPDEYLLDNASKAYIIDHDYNTATGESFTVSGQTYTGNEGIIIGKFSSTTISGAAIFFDKGDIGLTIRKKETPVSFFIEIDRNAKFPPYYIIKVNKIENEFGEPLPDNVRIALKSRHGKIPVGEEAFDWKIFNTSGGKVSEQILYEPPACEEVSSDIIEYAGVCEFNDFPPYIMEKRYEKKVPVCLTIHVRETESGAIKGDDGSTSYPYNYTVSMQFRGKIINSKSLFQTVAKLPDALRKMVMREGSMNLKDECTLIAELEPDEKSMKVEQWKCSDPVNNTPPPPLLGTHPAEFDVPTRIWQIGRKIYISHGFLEGILSYFPSWEDPRSSNSKEPAGARADGPSGEMGEYIEVPYEKFINGETITLKPKDVSDHNDDEWQWNTHWTVTINPD